MAAASAILIIWYWCYLKWCSCEHDALRECETEKK